MAGGVGAAAARPVRSVVVGAVETGCRESPEILNVFRFQAPETHPFFGMGFVWQILVRFGGIPALGSSSGQNAAKSALFVTTDFQWKFATNGRSKEFSGKNNANGKILALTRDADGDAMEGTVERTGGNSFRFRMKDAETGDPGLNFTR
jgi:hypothetical protein